MQELTPFISTRPAPSFSQMAICIGYNAASVRKEEKQQLVLDYTAVHERHWRRILANTITLVAEGLAPPLVEVRNKVFVFEHVARLSQVKPHAWLTPKDIVEKTTNLVQRLHDLGYGHGNLNINNLGINEAGTVYLLGLEYVYRLKKDKHASWLRYWMEFYCDCDSYEDFVQGDFENWKTDALDLTA